MTTSTAISVVCFSSMALGLLLQLNKYQSQSTMETAKKEFKKYGVLCRNYTAFLPVLSFQTTTISV
jgi:hypothetical protein